MRQKTPNPTMPEAVESERSIGATLVEFGGWLAAIVGVIALVTVVTSAGSFGSVGFDWEAWWLISIGRSFLADANWLLPMFLAGVLALYAALIGQSVTNTSAAEVLRTRGRLVPAGTGLASVVVAFAGAAALACITSPDQWPRMPGIGFFSLVICLLGIGIGRFESRSREDQLDGAQRLREQTHARLKALPSVSEDGPVPAAVLVGSIAAAVLIPTLPLLIAAAVTGSDAKSVAGLAGLLLLSNFVWMVVGLGLPLLLVQWSYDGGGPGRIAKNVVAAFLTPVLAMYAVLWLFDTPQLSSADPNASLVGVLFTAPGLVVFVLAVISLFPPKRLRGVSPYRLSLRRAIVELTRRSASRRIGRLDREVNELKVAIESRRPAPESLLSAVIGVLRDR